MLDFDNKTYFKILNLAIKHNVIANCREYPSLFLNRQKIDFSKAQKVLRQKFDNPEFACGLYIHFPFCLSRCSFCKYYSESFYNENIFNQYLENIKKELELYKINFRKQEICNLFLGGGTPTLLNAKQMASYLNIINSFFKLKAGAQITIEGTPESLSKEKLKQYRKLGINRISIGLQSSNNEVLKKIGRNHTVKDVFRAFDAVRQSGINYIGTEVIWGLPGESLKTYKKTVKDLIKLSPDFIEGYLLTTGGRVRIKRFYPPGMKLDKIINFFKEQLLANGYRIYYSSNFLGFIKKGISRFKAMNQNTDGLYNYYSDVLGIGAGASSHFSNLKYKTISSSKIYKKHLEKSQPPPLYGMNISRDDYKRHYIILQIGFYRAINKKRYCQLFGKNFSGDFPKEIAYLKEKRIIEETSLQYKWRLGEHEMGHKSFFMHVIQYWYNPKYIRQILEKYL
jgi:oxygen-independent coproporphyrinogen III oxidase